MGEVTPTASMNIVSNQLKRLDPTATHNRAYTGTGLTNHSMGSNTLQNSQIHGRKIDSPKIHASEI